MSDNYVIIHGSFSSPNSNWFPWLKEELEKKNKLVFVPQMPVGVGKQNFESWKKEIDKFEIDENTIIIAHSIAPIFVCRYLIEKQINVKKLVFVCGFNNYLGIDESYDAVNKSMYTNRLEEVKKYCNEIICFYSNNDPYVPFDIEKSFADKIADKKIIIKNGGHLNSESGYKTFDKILEVL